MRVFILAAALVFSAQTISADSVTCKYWRDRVDQLAEMILDAEGELGKCTERCDDIQKFIWALKTERKGILMRLNDPFFGCKQAL